MLFISHSTKDKAAALDLQARLRARGYACEQQFLDSDQRSGIRLGEKWEQAIYDNLRDCRALLVLCSPRWLESKWCFAELAAAKMAGKEVFPLVIEDCDRSPLGEYQAADLTNTDPAQREQAFERLFQDLEARGLGPKEHLPWPHPELKTADGQPDRCPFPGLLAFDERYAAVYFGREPETQVVLEELRKMRSQGEPRLLMIVGGSGSGKSSLLRAGVLPRLSHVTEAEHWLVLPTLRYGAAPSEEYTLFDQLARDLVGLFPPDARNIPDWKDLRTRLGADDLDLAAQALRDVTLDLTSARNCADATVLLAFDQFEELLSTAASPSAAKFLNFLQGAFRQRNTRLLAVGSMRSDYLDLYERNPYALVAPAFKPWRLGPVPRARIPDIIEKPAARARLQISQELVKKLEQDTPTAEALPLLAFTLEKLYRRSAADGKLELGEYHELGGMEGAIQKSVERVIPPRSLSPAVESALRLSFVKHLAQVNEKDEVVRRPARWSDLPAEAQPVLDQLVNERLLVKSEQDGAVRVEVAHEAMFRCWGDLKEWLRTSGDILRWRRDVERDRATDGTRWKRLRAAQLDQARNWPTTRAKELSDDEKHWIFVAVCWQWVWRSIVAAVFCFAGLFGWQWFKADRATKIAVTKEKEANNNLAEANYALGKVPFDKDDRDAAVLWWVKALETAEDEGLEASLRNLIGMWSPTERRLIHDDTLSRIQLSPNGTTLLTASGEETLQLWDIQKSVTRIKELKIKQNVWAIAFSPDGTRVLMGRGDNTAQLMDTSTGELTAPQLTHEQTILAVSFSPDGTKVCTGGADSTARLWDAHTGKMLLQPLEHSGSVSLVRFSSDSNTVMTFADGTIRLWDTNTGASRGGLIQDQTGIDVAEVSPNGQLVVTGSGDNTARVWSFQTGMPMADPLDNPQNVYIVLFSPLGETLLTVCLEGALLWDTQTWAVRGPPLKVSSFIDKALFSLTGDSLLTLYGDKGQLWNVRKAEPQGDPLQHDNTISDAAFSPDGQKVLTASLDHTVRLWDVATGAQVSEQFKHDSSIAAVAISADGHTVFTASSDKTARVWEAQMGTPRCRILRHDAPVDGIAFSPDGKTVLTASRDKAQLWDTNTGALRHKPLQYDGIVSAVAFSADGQTALTMSRENSAKASETGAREGWGKPQKKDVWLNAVNIGVDAKRLVLGNDVDKTRLWQERKGSGWGTMLKQGVYSGAMAFGRNSQIVLAVRTVRTDTQETFLTVCDMPTGVIRDLKLRHSSVVDAVALSPDGNWAITTSRENGTQLWDIRTGEEQGDGLVHDGEVLAVAFSPDSQMVLTGSEDNKARL